MTVQVKICGIHTSEALDAALAAGADYFGLVFYARSPRALGHVEARKLVARAGGRCRSVALLVDPTDRDVEAVVAHVAPDLIQLHGDESPERVAALKRLAGRPVIKAIKVANARDAAAGSAYTAADLLLYDAAAPTDRPGALPGGNGRAFDWQALTGIDRGRAFMLSGGLDVDNVAAAVRATRADIVDVSSGVERAPGDKDPALIARFVAAAKSVEPVS